MPPPSGFHALPWYEGVFTGMFMHASWEHILGNMLFLWIFGNNVEDAFGHAGFFFWYLAAGVVAMATQTFVTLEYAGVRAGEHPEHRCERRHCGRPRRLLRPLPRARVLTLIFIFIREIPAFWFLGIWFALQAWTGGLALEQPEAGGGVAFFAHIGGFAFGVLSGLFLLRARRSSPQYRLR